ncbi:hypothetical protein J2X76_005474 [Neorhizobium sp. 2083]|uniref:hypothetical protein n=1 Tax=Neorhizobium sp. 2083 TaxID=2817762 RepID=UPI00285ECAFE|nr:hypothetical protein [Neorhizobium sp. 2083]MDR6820277.1 hypothetical protein [Neorhizobium sp. 2083]
MALSEAEWKRRQEKEDAEPHYFGMTWGEFRRLPERKQQETRQRLTQFGATHVGFWKDCTLGKCRRARRCIGVSLRGAIQGRLQCGLSTLRARRRAPSRENLL